MTSNEIIVTDKAMTPFDENNLFGVLLAYRTDVKRRFVELLQTKPSILQACELEG